MIFQDPMSSLNPVLTIADQISETLRQHQGLTGAAARKRVVELLGLVRIPDAARRADDYPHRLSGGMRQRVMIAMAIACKPRLLIADEPTTALDVTIQAQILELLRDLRKELSMSVMLISHDLGVIAEFAQRVVVMYAGRVVEDAPVAQLFRRPVHPYTMGLIAAVPKLDSDAPRLATIPGRIPSPRRSSRVAASARAARWCRTAAWTRNRPCNRSAIASRRAVRRGFLHGRAPWLISPGPSSKSATCARPSPSSMPAASPRCMP